MGKSSRSGSAADPVMLGSDAAKALGSALTELARRGDLASIEKLTRDLSRRLELPAEALAPLVDRARNQVSTQRSKTGAALRSTAVDAGCHFDFRPPHAEIGCVRLHEKKPGQWILSILDDIPVETISTTDGSLLAKAALAHIHAIEKTLDQVTSTAKDLVEASGIYRRGAHSASDIPVNLLMLLASHGRGLRKSLVSATNVGGRSGLSRAQFGFLLARLNRLGKEDKTLPQLSFSGAAQGDAAKPHLFIPVPDIDDPRRKSNRRLVSTVTISQ